MGGEVGGLVEQACGGPECKGVGPGEYRAVGLQVLRKEA